MRVRTAEVLGGEEQVPGGQVPVPVRCMVHGAQRDVRFTAELTVTRRPSILQIVFGRCDLEPGQP